MFELRSLSGLQYRNVQIRNVKSKYVSTRFLRHSVSQESSDHLAIQGSPCEQVARSLQGHKARWGKRQTTIYTCITFPTCRYLDCGEKLENQDRRHSAQRWTGKKEINPRMSSHLTESASSRTTIIRSQKNPLLKYRFRDSNLQMQMTLFNGTIMSDNSDWIHWRECKFLQKFTDL